MTESSDEEESPPRQDQLIGNPCCTVCSCLLLFHFALLMLGWAESTYICTNKQEMFAQEHAHDAGCDASLAQHGISYVSCLVLPSSLYTFTPSDFNRQEPSKVEVPVSFKAAEAAQVAEMYQCQETAVFRERITENGAFSSDRANYSYAMVWSQAPLQITAAGVLEVIDACPDLRIAQFKNPAFPMNVEPGTRTRFAPSMRIGQSENASFLVPGTLFRNGLTVASVNLSRFASNFRGGMWTGVTKADTSGSFASPWLPPPSLVDVASLGVTPSGDFLVTCIGEARLGCLRISYQASTPASVSIIATVNQHQRTFESVKMPGSWGWDCGASEYYLLREGKISKDDMLSVTQSSTFGWFFALRMACCLGAVLALYCILASLGGCISDVGDCFGSIPCVGDCVDAIIYGLSLPTLCLISSSLSFAAIFLVIAAAWWRVNIIQTIIFIVLSLCCCCVLFAGSSRAVGEVGRLDHDFSEQNE